MAGCLANTARCSAAGGVSGGEQRVSRGGAEGLRSACEAPLPHACWPRCPPCSQQPPPLPPLPRLLACPAHVVGHVWVSPTGRLGVGGVSLAAAAALARQR